MFFFIIKLRTDGTEIILGADTFFFSENFFTVECHQRKCAVSGVNMSSSKGELLLLMVAILLVHPRIFRY